MSFESAPSLSSIFGFQAFRPGQQQVVDQLLAGQSSLAVFPTGSGKSLCYQYTALQLPHLTLVVSPLLALMSDQLAFLRGKGIAAASLDSTLTPAESRQVMAQARSGTLKILMVSVERFKNERFREFIKAVPISMLVVDEAHCISEWGHNFRPDYLKLPSYCAALDISLVLLLTATATKAVMRDMASKFSIADEHIVRTGFYRPNLDLSIVPVAEDSKSAQLATLLEQYQGAGIVYVTLQSTAQLVADYLCGQGIDAAAYHAGFDSEVRMRLQSGFMAGQYKVMVATIAFGMGIDKSDIRFVVHYDLPKSIENYSQEIGRAGRDGETSQCVTLANLDGLNTVENFVYGDTPTLSAIEYLLEQVRQSSEDQGKGLQWELQVLSLSNASNIRQLPLKTLLVQLELLGVIEPLYSYFAEFRYKFLSDREVVLARFEGERQDFLRRVFDRSAFKRVWGAPDFDGLFRDYRYERGRIVTALEYLQNLGCIELESKRMTEVFSVNAEALSREDLARRLFDYFTDKEQKEIRRIAALIRFFELDRCLNRNLALYFADAQAPEQCGHCSVCRGRVATLSLTREQAWPADDQIAKSVAAFNEFMLAKHGELPVREICVRFLAGITMPLFNRFKVRQLPGFGLCGHLRYADIGQKMDDLHVLSR